MLNKFLPLFNRLKYKIVYSVSSFFKTDEHQELLKKVNTRLLVWEQTLFNLDSGDSTAIDDMSAEALASAAHRLLKKNKQISRAALYLHPSEFVTTEYQLPNIAVQNIVAALKYQVDNLLPAYPRALLLTTNHNEGSETNIALWFDQPRSEQLFNAFNEQGIELITIAPRTVLAMLSESIIKNAGQQVKETDQQGRLSIVLENQRLIQWVQISQQEMQDKDYLLQWQEELLETDNSQTISIENESFFNKLDFSHIDQIHYTFFPDAARQSLKQRSRLKKGRLAVIAGVILLLLLSAPFIQNKIRYNKYEQRYLEYKEKTIEVRKMRASVNQFEENWALFLEHPKVDAAAIVDKLNKIIPKNSWITVFELKDNEVEIEGNSPNAAGILEVISKQDEFDEVAFNQRTRSERGRNEHFGISFRMKNNTIEAYRNKFLSEQQ